MSFLPARSFAAVAINEIMYDLAGTDTKREWAEIQNTGTEAVTFIVGGTNSAWRFSDGSQHTLTLSKGSATLAGGEFAVIVEDPVTFLNDWPNFSGNLFDSSFSLNNTNGVVSLLTSKDGAILDQASCNSSQGASGDGNSLQRLSDGTWVTALPTPGLINATTAYTPPINSSSSDQVGEGNSTTTATTTGPVESNISGGGGSYSSHSGQEELTKAKDEPVAVGAGRVRLGTVGSPLDFRAEKGTSFTSFNFRWSFGDGAEAIGERVTHTYLFAGDYQVVLHGFYDGIKEAVSRTTVKITDPKISILRASPPAGFVELANDSEQEINLNGWSLDCDKTTFPFPRDLIISAQTKLKLPLYLTKCASSTVAWKLLNGIGRPMASYSGTKVLVKNDPPTISGEAVDTVFAKRQRIAEAVALAWKTADFGEKKIVEKIEPVAMADSGSSTKQKDILQTAGVIVLDGANEDPISWWQRIGSWFK